MSKLKIFTLIGILLLLCIGLIRSQQFFTSASAQPADVPTPPYPVAPEDQPLLEKLQAFPYSETPYEGAPVLHPDPAYDTLSKEERQKLAETAKASQQIINLTGIETAGSKIWVPGKGKEIQLPENVYVSHYIAFITCYPVGHCPGTPYYVLETTDSQTQVRLEPDGQAYIWDKGAMTPERFDLYRNTYQPILEQLGAEIVLDPDIERANKDQEIVPEIQ